MGLTLTPLHPTPTTMKIFVVPSYCVIRGTSLTKGHWAGIANAFQLPLRGGAGVLLRVWDWLGLLVPPAKGGASGWAAQKAPSMRT